MEERSPYDPRPATARPVGTVDRVVADDGQTEVWVIVRVEGEREREVHLNRISMIKAEMETIEDFDEEECALRAIESKYEERREMKRAMALEVQRLEELVK